MRNPYLPILMRIERIIVETDDEMLKSFDLVFVNESDGQGFSFMPGQFCEISVFGKGEAPFGFASSPLEQGYLRITVNKAGVLTTALHDLAEGDIVGLRGPLGNGYPLHLFEGHNIVVIGGGFAFTTLRSLVVYMLHSANRAKFGEISIVYGARQPGLLLYKQELSIWGHRDDVRLYLTVDKRDETWRGREALVPNVVEEVAPNPKNAYAVICGPSVMIRYTLPKLSALGFSPDQIYTSLERRMKCGLGKCGRCNIGPYYVCEDGPVFSYAQLNGLPKEY